MEKNWSMLRVKQLSLCRNIPSRCTPRLNSTLGETLGNDKAEAQVKTLAERRIGDTVGDS